MARIGRVNLNVWIYGVATLAFVSRVYVVAMILESLFSPSISLSPTPECFRTGCEGCIYRIVSIARWTL